MNKGIEGMAPSPPFETGCVECDLLASNRLGDAEHFTVAICSPMYFCGECCRERCAKWPNSAYGCSL